MSIQKTYTFTWDFGRFETVDTEDFSQVVTKVHFTLWGEDNLGRRIPYYGNFDLDEPVRDEFTTFEDLTPSMVESWAEESLGEDEISRITDQLVIQLNQEDITPPTTNREPPWHK